MNEQRFTINLDPFTGHLQHELMADLTSLRVVLKAIEDETYKDVAKYAPKSQFVHWTINPLPDPEVLRAREINKCLKAVCSSLQDYMDRLIAVINFCEGSKASPIPATEDITAEELLSQALLRELRSVSENNALTANKKIEMLLGNDPMKEVVQNYYGLRNGLEHHKGIAKKDRLTTFKRMSFVADSGKEIREVIGPGLLNEGESLALRIVDEEISFKEGDTITLSYSQLENIIFTILQHVPPKMTQAVMNITNGT